jgi:hypothetical protein
MIYLLIESIAVCFSVIPFLFGRSINKPLLGCSFSILSFIFCIFNLVLLAFVLSIVSVFLCHEEII